MDRQGQIVNLSNSLYDLLSEEDIRSLNKLSNSAEFQVVMKIAEKHFPVLLGSQLINIDLSNPIEIEIVKLNQKYVDAVHVFLMILWKTTRGEAISYHNDEFIYPNYDSKESDINIKYWDFIERWISWQDFEKD